MDEKHLVSDNNYNTVKMSPRLYGSVFNNMEHEIGS